MPAIRGLAEIVIFVDDLERSLRFYRDLLGLEVISPPSLKAVFLRVGAEVGGVPQQIVLVPRPTPLGATSANKADRDLHHIGLEVPAAEFEAERTRIAGQGISVRAGEHPFLPVEAFYIDDPDGHEVEIVAHTGQKDRN